MVLRLINSIGRYVLLLQTDGQLRILKHVYIPQENVPGAYVATLLQGSGGEIASGSGNKKLVRKAVQWMLEQLGGTQFRKFSLSAEKRKVVSVTQVPEDEGWSFIREHGGWTRVTSAASLDPFPHQ